MKTLLIGLVLGLGGGAAGGYFGRPTVDRALSGMSEIEGVVVAEAREDDRLVLTLRAGDETILASFRERAADVEGLVSLGDRLTVRIGAPGVFVDDVPIVRLRRAVDAPVSRRRHRGDAGVEVPPAPGTAAEHGETARDPDAPSVDGGVVTTEVRVEGEIEADGGPRDAAADSAPVEGAPIADSARHHRAG